MKIKNSISQTLILRASASLRETKIIPLISNAEVFNKSSLSNKQNGRLLAHLYNLRIHESVGVASRRHRCSATANGNIG